MKNKKTKYKKDKGVKSHTVQHSEWNTTKFQASLTTKKGRRILTGVRALYNI